MRFVLLAVVLLLGVCCQAVRLPSTSSTRIQVEGPSAFRPARPSNVRPLTSTYGTGEVNPSLAVAYGNSAYVYDYNGGRDMQSASALWWPILSKLPQAPDGRLSVSTVFSYGGDMEIYEKDSKTPYQTYFNTESQQAASTYYQSTGTVYPVVDGRMDGGQSWSPDLSKLNSSQIEQWADVTASLYCSFQTVGGISVDLEPYTEPYTRGVNQFLARLSANLRSPEMNCVSPAYPNGRAINYFTFADKVTQDLVTALGPNGYVVVSGYDLSAAPAGTVSTPEQYATAFQTMLSQINSFPEGTRFSVAIPGAASTHEFTAYRLANGNTIQGYPMYSTNSSAPSYVNIACDQLAKAIPNWGTKYIGTTLWGFSSRMEYPVDSNNVFYPGMPFSQEGEYKFLSDWLVKNIPKSAAKTARQV